MSDVNKINNSENINDSEDTTNAELECISNENEEESSSNDTIEDIRTSIFNDNVQNKDESISVTSQQRPASEFSSFLIYGSNLSEYYHTSEIKLVHKIIYWSVAIFSVVTLFFMGMIIYIFYRGSYDAKDLIPIFSGCIIEIMTVVITKIMQSFIQSKNSYFQESTKAEDKSKIICLILTVEDENRRSQMIEKLIDNYCCANK